MHGVPRLVMPAIVRATPISLIPLRSPVVPGRVATDRWRQNPLIPMGFMDGAVTVATPIHGVYAMCNPDIMCLPPIGGMANGPKFLIKGHQVHPLAMKIVSSWFAM